MPRPVSVNSTSMSASLSIMPTRRVLDTLVQANHDVRIPLIVGTVMDIVVWLRSLGLGKYEAVFRENDIDETVLPSLTHENLKELGVTSFGHRVKLLDAIAALRNDADVKPLTQRPRRERRAPAPIPARLTKQVWDFYLLANRRVGQ